jgi:hypothetical protein
MPDAVAPVALHVAASLVVPFVWAVFVHWIFEKIDAAAAARGEERPVAVRPAAADRSSEMWDYNI